MHRLNAERWRGGGGERRRKGGEDGEKVKSREEGNVGNGVERRCYVEKQRPWYPGEGRESVLLYVPEER